MQLQFGHGGLAFVCQEGEAIGMLMRARRRWIAAFAAIGLAACGSGRAFDRLPRYRGALHIHTDYSDGSGSFPVVLADAEASGLDFIVTSDHGTLAPLRDGMERYWGKTLALVGVEISTNGGHYLAMDLPAGFRWASWDPQTVIERVAAAGGFGFLAHPLTQRWRWADFGVRGYTGIEVVNLASLLDDATRTHSIAAIRGHSITRALRFARHYRHDAPRAMAQVTEDRVNRERTLWNDLLEQRPPVVGIGSVDAHALVRWRRHTLKAPSYRDSFESIQTYVATREPFTGDVPHDRRQVYDSLRHGRAYIVFGRIGRADWFDFTAVSRTHRATMGDAIGLDRPVRLRVEAPPRRDAVVRIVLGDREIAATVGRSLEVRVKEPGAYRCEVYVPTGNEVAHPSSRPQTLTSSALNGRHAHHRLAPWVFSNPIYVTPRSD